MSLFNEFGDLEENFDLKDAEEFGRELNENFFGKDDNLTEEEKFAREVKTMSLSDYRTHQKIIERQFEIFESTGVLPDYETVKEEILKEETSRKEGR